MLITHGDFIKFTYKCVTQTSCVPVGVTIVAIVVCKKCTH